jgi:regulator of sigma E protease
MSVLLFIVILVALILVHEWGHFIVAKKTGMRVDEFGLGFPPKLFGWKRGETEYTFNALPFGGFVKIFGEDPKEGETDPRAKTSDKAGSSPDASLGDASRAFTKQPKLAQAAVLVAGVAMNVIFAWVLLSAGFSIGMPQALSKEEVATAPDARLVITGVLPGSPAERAGLLAGDTVRALSREDDVFETKDPEEATAFIASSTGGLSVVVLRGTEDVSVAVVPEAGVVESDPERHAIGVSLSAVGIVRLPVHEALVVGTLETARSLQAVVVGLAIFLAGIFTWSADISSVTGPVGIIGIVGDTSAFGFSALIALTAFISLNLAVINLLPFPALDGGRLLFLAIEAVKGSPIRPAIANALNLAGFALLILLMLVVTYNDIARLLG